MYKLPFNRGDIQFIGNYVNHGDAPNPIPDGYIRDGVYCVTGDNDNTKPTYWHGSFRHDGTDFQMPVGSPIFAPCDGEISASQIESTTAGINCELREDAAPGERLYFRFLHLSELRVHDKDYVRQGELIAFSGDTGICGAPHLHLSIGTSSGSGNVDPLTDNRFKHCLQGIPYITREGHHAPHFKPFAWNSPELTINGKAQTIGWNGQEMEYKFKCTEPILRLLNVTKYTDHWHDIEHFDLISELGNRGALSEDTYDCIILHDAQPGWYYYQAETHKGWTAPVRVMLKDRIIL